MRNPSIAAVVPVFNPEPGLKALCVSLLEAYGTVVVVDDGSAENVEDFKSLPAGIDLVRHEVNRGKGRAIKTSIEWLKANRPDVTVAVFVDGDGQHRPDDVATVVARCQAAGTVPRTSRRSSPGARSPATLSWAWATSRSRTFRSAAASATS